MTTFGNYLVYGGYVFPHDRLKIVKKPSLLVDNPVIGWGTAFAFYIKPYVQQTTTTMNTIITTERPSMHQVMMPDGFQKLDNSTVIDKGQHGEFGFGQTINVINGSMECKNELTVLSLNRINAYIEALIRLGAPIKNVKVTFSDGSSEIIDVNHLKSNVFHPIKFIKSSSWEAFYNSAPLPLKYYNLNTQSNEKAIKSIELYYGDTSNIKRERLDCIGYSVWS